MLVTLVCASGASASVEAWFAPRAEPWDRWTAHDPSSGATIDHGDWDRFLKTYLVNGPEGDTRLAYGRVSRDDRRALDGYLAKLMALPVSSYNRDEQRAFWINLYNAATVQLVLERYPVESIRDIDISPGLFSAGPWGKKFLRVESVPVSLNDIEHRILRPLWRDARIHYALNCAALGCPNLQPAAYTGANTMALLDAGAGAYVNHPRGADVENGLLVVSSIYVWFKEDFGGTDAGVIDHLRRYASAALAARLALVKSIGSDRYDWRLNDAR